MATKYSFEIDELLSKFQEWQFKITNDSIGTFCKGNPLYYKSIGENNYIVFNYFNSTKKSNRGFDCWLAKYSNFSDIGVKKPLEMESIRLSFHLDADFDLIEGYLHPVLK